MKVSFITPAAAGGYAQAVQLELAGPVRFVYVSGQTAEIDGQPLAEDFRQQCRDAWRNVETRLRDAQMTLDDVVNVTVFLASREYAAENRIVRTEVLGRRTPALTVVVATLLDPRWLVEINAVAVR
jgi:enamine deaminase RidA (YjgF/YER057c/UK114 family)